MTVQLQNTTHTVKTFAVQVRGENVALKKARSRRARRSGSLQESARARRRRAQS